MSFLGSAHAKVLRYTLSFLTASIDIYKLFFNMLMDIDVDLR